MNFWFGTISASETANRIIRYCGIGWIVWACLCVVATFVSKTPAVLLGAVFCIAVARAYLGRSRTAAKMIFGLLAFCAGANILVLLAKGAGYPLLTAMELLVWFALPLSALRVIQAIEFLNDEDLKTAGTA